MTDTKEFGGFKTSEHPPVNDPEEGANRTNATGPEPKHGAVDAAAATLREAKNQVRDKIEEGKEQQAGKISGVARAIHGAADELKDQMPETADYIHKAADNVERLSTMLRDRPAEDLLHEVNRFAHRRPLAMFGAAILAGVAIARFLKSSPRTRGGFGSTSARGDAS